MRTFNDVRGEALEETRDKFVQRWKNPDDFLDAVNYALGLFTGIVLRRMRGEPDPDPPEKQNGDART